MNSDRSAGQATLCIADNAVGLINRVNSGFTSQPEWMARLARKGSTARPPLWMSAERPIFLTRGRVRLNGWRLLLITKEEVAWARIPHRAEEVVPPLRSAGFTICAARAVRQRRLVRPVRRAVRRSSAPDAPGDGCPR